MKTQDLESIVNSEVQKVLAGYRKNKIPAPWGREYMVLREFIRNTIINHAE